MKALGSQHGVAQATSPWVAGCRSSKTRGALIPDLENPKVLSRSRYVISAGRDGLVKVYVPVPDLDIEAAARIGADPSLVMYRRSLATVVR